MINRLRAFRKTVLTIPLWKRIRYRTGLLLIALGISVLASPVTGAAAIVNDSINSFGFSDGIVLYGIGSILAGFFILIKPDTSWTMVFALPIMVWIAAIIQTQIATYNAAVPQQYTGFLLLVGLSLIVFISMIKE